MHNNPPNPARDAGEPGCRGQSAASAPRRLLGHLADLAERLALKLATKRARFNGALLRMFLAEGRGPISIGPGFVMRGRRHVHCLGHFTAQRRNRIEAYDRHGGRTYSPKIIFGDKVSMEDDCHIAAVNRIELHDNVLLASKVYISDHSHGTTSYQDLRIPPNARPVVSRGPVVIEADVWIGEGAAILPGVRIGRGAVVGANAVVTRDVPCYCTVAGVPARVISRHWPPEQVPGPDQMVA